MILLEKMGMRSIKQCKKWIDWETLCLISIKGIARGWRKCTQMLSSTRLINHKKAEKMKDLSPNNMIQYLSSLTSTKLSNSSSKYNPNNLVKTSPNESTVSNPLYPPFSNPNQNDSPSILHSYKPTHHNSHYFLNEQPDL